MNSLCRVSLLLPLALAMVWLSACEPATAESRITSACADMCAASDVCGFDHANCRSDCVESIGGGQTAECADAVESFAACYVGGTCPSDSLETPMECVAEAAATNSPVCD